MSEKLKEISARIKSLREILGISAQDAAKSVNVSLEEYTLCESGEKDFSATFLLKIAELFNVDATDILTGKSPTLSTYTLTRANEGLSIERRKGFSYESLAHHFKNRQAEPFVVNAPYTANAQDRAIALSSHAGQEFDYILQGSLKFQINNKVEILHPGDSVFYDSSNPHGMVAVNGDCKFLAIVIKK